MLRCKHWLTLLLLTLSLSAISQDKKEKVLTLIDSSQLHYPKIAKKIFLAESAHGKAPLFKKHNNIFAFKLNRRKLHNGSVKGYCSYQTLSHSMQDYQLWEHGVVQRFKLNTREKFLHFVARNYSKNGSYLKLLNGINI